MADFQPAAVTDPAEWDARVAAAPYSHLLQSWQWGAFKAHTTGWQPQRLCWPLPGGRHALAQVLARAALGLRVLYVPKGPLLDWADEAAREAVLAALENLARRQRAVLIKIDPDVVVSAGPPGAEAPDATGEAVRDHLARRGWRFSREQVQFRNTVTLDLTRSEADLLAGMKQKTRYNVRLAERKGVTVRAASLADGEADLDLLYRLYAETSVRDGFVIRAPAYYREAWQRFAGAGLAQPFVAEVEGQPVSALIVYRFGPTAWYMYGMSTAQHRDKMPNHLLQWHAIRWARAQGCRTYDFWGAPDAFVESDPLWGVWKFKEGFGGQVVRHLGAWDFAPSPALYRLYTTVLPRVLAVLRWRGRRATRAALE